MGVRRQPHFLTLLRSGTQTLRIINEGFLADLLRKCQPTLELIRDRGRKMDPYAWYEASMQLNVAEIFVENSARFRFVVRASAAVDPGDTHACVCVCAVDLQRVRHLH